MNNFSFSLNHCNLFHFKQVTSLSKSRNNRGNKLNSLTHSEVPTVGTKGIRMTNIQEALREIK